ncbi:MAG TPA: ThuA domain-containing protein [Candidatus Acidoferrum sp.]|nr:ThuA domain-containing protein [Candidatus Acidoferrum sp.]
MNCNRREFLRHAALAGATLAIGGRRLLAQQRKSVLVFTKSSGFEHQVVKRVNGQQSIMEAAVRELGNKNGFGVETSKDGRVFNSKEFLKYAAVIFFTTGDLTKEGTDKNPPMSPAGKEALLSAIHAGRIGFVGVHAASDTFHTEPDTPDNSNRYIAHGEKSDPYIRMLGGEFITHGSDPRLQTAEVIVNDPSFPGLSGVTSPVSFTEEWYSLKDFRDDLHVILTLDTKGMRGACYDRPPYPVAWTRMEGKGRVFFTALGDRPENWQSEFMLNLLAGGIRWAIRDVDASSQVNLKEAAPGYATIPPKETRN